ncbi:MAG: hypothetical protein MJ086_03390 [Lachnospiraceae bacterium]|nr:hypothetical protein [Lachnospiraceae bacterium]
MAEEYVIGKAYVQVLPTTKEFGSTLKGSIGEVDTESMGKESGGKFGTGFKIAASAIGAMLGAAIGGFAELSKAVLDSYGEFEQLEGGVKKLFGDDYYSEVVTNAKSAFSEMQISANDYMETVTSFSASLISSLGGNQEEAVRYADVAMRSMADNANTFGTSMESIQNAYQGFAKQNYTMLDNLKLGYGGTASEMERLIADAAQYTDSQEKLNLSVKEGDMSFGNIVAAIEVMQDHLNIAGTSSKEAASTIQGSLNMTKAAWANLITDLGNENADIEASTQALADSITAVFQNMTPVIENIIKAVPTVISGLLASMKSMLPSVLQTLSGLFRDILNMVVTTLPEILPVVVDFIIEIADAVIDNLPVIIDAVLQVIVSIIEALAEALPELITAIVDAIPQIIDSILEALPLIIAGLITLVLAIVDALPEIIQSIINALPQIISSIITALIECLPQLINGCVQLVINLVEHIPEIILALIQSIPEIVQTIATTLAENFGPLFSAIGDFFSQVWDKLTEWLGNILENVGEWFSGIWTSISEWFSGLFEDLAGWFAGIFESIGSFFGDIFNNIGTWLDENIWQPISDFFSNAWELGKQLVTGIWEGISGAASWLWEKITGWVSGIWDGIKDFFGIASPSKQMAWIGDMMMEGLGKGIDNNAQIATDAVANMGEDILSTMDAVAADVANTSLGSGVALSMDRNINESFIAVAAGEMESSQDIKLAQIVTILDAFLPDMLDAFQNIGIVLDDGTLVGKLMPTIDQKMASMQSIRERGGTCWA